MADDQQQGRSPSQIAASAKSQGHGQEQQQHSRSPSEIAASARSVHGPDGGHAQSVRGEEVQPLRSPSEIAAGAYGNMQSAQDQNAGHVLLNGNGDGPDGKGWAAWLEEQRAKNKQGGNTEDQNNKAKGRALPPEERERQKQEEKDKGRSPAQQVEDWIHDHGFDICQ